MAQLHINEHTIYNGHVLEGCTIDLSKLFSSLNDTGTRLVLRHEMIHANISTC